MLFLLCFIVQCSILINAFPEETRWTTEHTLTKDDPTYLQWFHATLFANTTVSIKLDCASPDDDSQLISVRFLLRYTPCSGNYIFFEEKEAITLFNDPKMFYGNEHTISYYDFPSSANQEVTFAPRSCNQLIDLNFGKIVPNIVTLSDGEEDSQRDKRDVLKREEGSETSAAKTSSTPTTEANAVTEEPVSKGDPMSPASNPNSGVIGKTWTDGPFVLIIEVKLGSDSEPPTDKSSADVKLAIDFKGPGGYLSALDQPLYAFYATMCVVYALFALLWITFCFRHWKDLLRVQFWICAVIGLGFIEKAVFLAEYQHMQDTGVVLKGVEMFAEMVSILKRTLARILVIIVSLGFGIVKPRLGDLMKQVLAAGFFYFIFASVEAGLRLYEVRDNRSNSEMFAAIPLAVIDAIICYWIMTSLLQTLKNLKLRRNVVKLTLYRHFFNILCFCVLAALVYIVWSIMTHKVPKCFTDWREIWIDTAYWHVLFSVILFGIIILWRPSQNNQRYAFSPLMDRPDDEYPDYEDDELNGDQEKLMNNMESYAAEDVKIRSKYKSNFNPKMATHDPTEDENLKWVEEHIPSAGFDTALPLTLADSDEDGEKTKQEMNKMQ